MLHKNFTTATTLFTFFNASAQLLPPAIKTLSNHSIRIKFVIFFMHIMIVAVGQKNAYQPLWGTNCSLVPPPGFIQEKNSGFRNRESDESITAIERPISIHTSKSQFDAALLKSRNMMLINKRPINYYNWDATLFKVRVPTKGATYIEQILLFGDSAKAVLVKATYPESNISIEDDIHASLLSTVYNENQKNSALENTKFRIDVSYTVFKFTMNMSGALLYTLDGQFPTKSTDHAKFTLGSSFKKVPAEARKEYCSLMLGILSYTKFNSQEITPVIIDSLDGFEIVAHRQNENVEKELVYLLMLFDVNGNNYFLFGLSLDKFGTYLTTFRNISNTFKRNLNFVGHDATIVQAPGRFDYSGAQLDVFKDSTIQQPAGPYTKEDSIRFEVYGKYNDGLASLDSLTAEGIRSRNEYSQDVAEIDSLRFAIKSELRKKNADFIKAKR